MYDDEGNSLLSENLSAFLDATITFFEEFV
jgi:hypothetical protein